MSDKLKPVNQAIESAANNAEINNTLDSALRTINALVQRRGNWNEKQAFSWICDHVIFLPVPEKRANLSLIGLIRDWLTDMVDHEAEQIAVLIDKRHAYLSDLVQHLEAFNTAEWETFLTHLSALAEQTRRRKGTARDYFDRGNQQK